MVDPNEHQALDEVGDADLSVGEIVKGEDLFEADTFPEEKEDNGE